jgi:lipopolysaccharide biosynthesis glycosyltransferase
VLEHCENNVIFHVFESGLTAENIAKIRAGVSAFHNASLDLRRSELDKNRFIEAKTVSSDVYICALLPDLLPELERIIWIDGDTVIERNISELWDVGLGGCVAAMAPDYSLENTDAKKIALGIENYTYYNTGVALMDLAALRSLDMPRVISENIVSLHAKVLERGLNWYPNQDTMNYVLRGRIKTLPFKFNSYFWMSLPRGETLDDAVEALLNPVIVHYIGNPKPNTLSRIPVNSPDWERYFKYKALTPFADAGDAGKIARYKERENSAMNALSFVSSADVHHHQVNNHSHYFAPRLFKAALDFYKTGNGSKPVCVWGLNNQTWLLVAYLEANGVRVGAVVDGLSGNTGVGVFDLVVGRPDILEKRAGEYFVLLDMRSRKIADKVTDDLHSWGCAISDYYHVHAPLWDGVDL